MLWANQTNEKRKALSSGIYRNRKQFDPKSSTIKSLEKKYSDLVNWVGQLCFKKAKHIHNVIYGWPIYCIEIVVPCTKLQIPGGNQNQNRLKTIGGPRQNLKCGSLQANLISKPYETFLFCFVFRWEYIFFCLKHQYFINSNCNLSLKLSKLLY